MTETCTELIMDRSTMLRRRCKMKVKENNLCRIHYKEDLDQLYGHNLMNLYTSWNEIDKKEHIKLLGEMWPIHIIIDTITQQINTSNMENAYPIYPHNPFTRKPFLPKDLIELKNQTKLLDIKLNPALKLLLDQSEKSLNILFQEASGYLDRHSILLMSLFQQHLRFKIINCKNSQDNYVGYWVKKNNKMSKFEEIYTKFRQEPYQVVHRGMIINNPYREYLKDVLKKLPIDESQPTDESLKI